MKRFCVIPFLLYSSVVFSDVEAVVNNIAKIIVAEGLCKYEINDLMVNVYIDSNISDRTDLQPGGLHYRDFEKALGRINSLTSTPDASKPFCKQVLNDFPAYFKYDPDNY
jgi:hypothetical protein